MTVLERKKLKYSPGMAKFLDSWSLFVRCRKTYVLVKGEQKNYM